MADLRTASLTFTYADGRELTKQLENVSRLTIEHEYARLPDGSLDLNHVTETTVSVTGQASPHG